MNEPVDLFTLAVGIVSLIASAFFLVADEPTLHDAGRVLVPIALVTAGTVLLVGSLRRRA